MKYNGPIGALLLDIDPVTEEPLPYAYAPFINGNRKLKIEGSKVPAARMEHVQRELVNFFQKNQLTPTNADLHQLSRGTQNSSVIYGADSGTENAIVVTLDPAPAAHVSGMTIRVKKSTLANTGAVTMDIGLGAQPLVKMDGSAFALNELPGNSVFEATWSGNNWVATNYFGIQAASYSVTNNYAAKIPYCVDTSSNSNHITAPYNPAITSLSAGKILMVKLNRAFTGGATDMTINAMTAISVVRGDGSDPLQGDGFVGQVLMLEYDGVKLQILNSSIPSKPLPIVLADTKSPTQVSGTFSSGAWRTRDLNTVVADPFGLVAAGLVTLANNRFTLAAGKWLIEARANCASINKHQHRLWNVTDGVQAIKGTHGCGWDEACHFVTQIDYIDGMLDIAATKTFEIQGMASSSTSVMGFGTSNTMAVTSHTPGGHGMLVWTGDTGNNTFCSARLTKVS